MKTNKNLSTVIRTDETEVGGVEGLDAEVAAKS